MKIVSLVPAVVLAADAVLTCLIILKVPYTEIDWKAYMQEVEGVLGGEYDYAHLKGDTGPLVYPAGFVYVFVALRWMSDNGTNIVKAQWLFAAVYMLTQVFVFLIYTKFFNDDHHQVMKKENNNNNNNNKNNNTRLLQRLVVVLVLLCVSRRVHSIYVLRLFNDGVAVCVGYAAIYAFMNNKWFLGSVLFSIGVSIKMNLLLYAPSLLWLFLLSGGIASAVKHISICAVVQLVLGVPFLLTNPLSYMHKSFELDRVFFYVWTVNWKCISEEIFLSKSFAISLLAAHLVLLACVFRRHASKCKIGSVPRIPAQYVVQLMFAVQMCGIAVARTLHYQFYSWYFHTLPLLLWCAPYATWLRIGVVVGVEVAFNVFPATWWSSLLLQACHLAVMGGILLSPAWDDGLLAASIAIKKKK